VYISQVQIGQLKSQRVVHIHKICQIPTYIAGLSKLMASVFYCPFGVLFSTNYDNYSLLYARMLPVNMSISQQSCSVSTMAVRSV